MRSSHVRRTVVALLATAVVVGCSSPADENPATVAPAAPVAATRTVPAKTGVEEPFRSVRDYERVAVPVRLRIPTLGVDTALERVGLETDGTVAAPGGWQVAGWYEKGPRPGQEGPAVIVGHVDSKSGPAVFFRLDDLRREDAVYVDRADGSTVRFRVTSRWQVLKSNFPADLVYAPTLEASLRLVTCGGIFDPEAGHYRDNIVVSAIPG